MASKISVVINTLNEESNIERVIKSVSWADEILICDMYSDDKTVEISKKMGARVIYHKRVSYVEPARNFAVSKSSNEWILVLDPDEEVTESLKVRLLEVSSKMKQIDYVRIPRKNLIFGRWMKASMWWPDLNIRFFKKGTVEWSNKIHRPPKTAGEGIDLESDEKWAIVHYHYASLTEYIERMIRYTKIQAEELEQEGYHFDWKDLIQKPLGEFLGRFFANRGFEDGLHGFVLSLLQAFSHLLIYLRLWEKEGFKSIDINLTELKDVRKKSGSEIDYWFKYGTLSKNPFKRFFQKVKNRI